MRLSVDAHEDIAWNMLTVGRDPTRSVAETRALEAGTPIPQQQGETLLGYPDYLRGGIAIVFATLHSMPVRRKLFDWETLTYATQPEAHRLGRTQGDVSHPLGDEHPSLFGLVAHRADLP